MTGSDQTVYYTDGWHPTVNPSSRMVIHHMRFNELLNIHSGILNEFPRRRGGSTLRFMRFDDQHFRVLELPTLFEFIPWWMPASPDSARAYLYPCFDQALNHRELLTRRELETIETIQEQLKDVVDTAHDHTLGELLNGVNEQNYRTIVPDLPKLELASLTRSPIRHQFASTIRALVPFSRLATAMSLWASKTGGGGFPMLAVGYSDDGSLYRVGWSQEDRCFASAKFDPKSGSLTSTPDKVDGSWLADRLDAGMLIPGSRLASLVEVAIRQTGVSLKHFGNNYGRLAEAAAILEYISGERVQWEGIIICEDDADSWHVAVVRDASRTYPVHLIDTLLCKAEALSTMPTYVCSSLSARTPVVLRPGSTLSETILDRRP